MEFVGARAQHLIDRPVECESPLLVEHHHPVDEADRRIEVVLDEEDRPIALGHQAGEGVVDLLDSARVEVRGRLVQHQQGRSHGQRAGDGEALPSAAREPVGVLAPPLPQAHAAQRRLGACEHVCHRHPQILRTECDLVEQRARDQLCIGILEDHAHPRAELGDGGVGRVVTADLDRAPNLGRQGVGDESVQSEGQCRLARSAGSEQQNDFAHGDVE